MQPVHRNCGTATAELNPSYFVKRLASLEFKNAHRVGARATLLYFVMLLEIFDHNHLE